jgi:hypothetical protein
MALPMEGSEEEAIAVMEEWVHMEDMAPCMEDMEA